MRLALRILLSILVWFVRIVVFAIPAVVGFIVIPLLICTGRYRMRPSKHFDRSVLQFPWWAWPLSNQEDGVDGLRGGDPAQAWWAEKTQGWPDAKRIFVWAAIRNPVDNLRFVPLLNPRLVPAKVRFVGMDHEPAKGEGGWYFAYQGIYSCIRFETTTWRLWVGTKIKPTDRFGISDTDPRKIRCDFALQFKRIS